MVKKEVVIVTSFSLYIQGTYFIYLHSNAYTYFQFFPTNRGCMQYMRPLVSKFFLKKLTFLKNSKIVIKKKGVQ